MKAGQLDKLSLKQLRELQDVIAAAISAREVHERSELKKKLAEMAGKAGFNVAELLGQRRPKARTCSRQIPASTRPIADLDRSRSEASLDRKGGRRH